MKRLRFLYYFACVAALLTVPAHAAYVDPNTTTLLISGVAAIAIAAGAVIGSAVRKAKKKTMDALGIDENAKKTVEDDLVVFSEEEKAGPEAPSEADK